MTLHKLGDTAREVGNWPEAIAAYQESLAHHWTQRDPLGVADALLRLAQILVALGDVELAARFFGRAEAQRERTGTMVFEPARLGYEQAVAAARAALGDDPFQAAWDAGRSLPLADAIEMAANLRASPSPALDRAAAPEPSSRLSAREREVLRLVVEGLSDPEIAEALSIVAARSTPTSPASSTSSASAAQRPRPPTPYVTTSSRLLPPPQPYGPVVAGIVPTNSVVVRMCFGIPRRRIGVRTRPTSTGPDAPAPSAVAKEGRRPMHALVITFRSAVAREELQEDFTRAAEALRDGAARSGQQDLAVRRLDRRQLLPLRGPRGRRPLPRRVLRRSDHGQPLLLRRPRRTVRR